MAHTQELRKWLVWIAVAAGFAAFYAVYFAPVWLAGMRLAPGDGELYYLPFYLAPVQLWSPQILAGYSVIGDPQSQTVYPLRIASPTFNVFVISAYVIAAIGTFGLALHLTGSRVASAGAALVMSGSGFMLAHLGHVSIIHAGAWTPAMLWAIAGLGGRRSLQAVAAGAIATALSFLGGHPQIAVIGLLLCAAFALHRVYGSWRERGSGPAAALAGQAMAMFVLGAMLAAPMLAAALQSASDSVRGAWSRNDFDSYRHTFASLRMFVFPNLYGAITEGPYGGYRGPGSPTELASYVGLLPVFLAFVAVTGRRERSACLFWGGAALVAVVLTLGTATPLGEGLFHMPVLGRFRAPARFGLAAVIALSILSAYGLCALLREPPSRARAFGVVGASALFCAIGVGAVAWAMPMYSGGIPKTWTQAGLWIAPVMMAVSLVTVVLLLWRPSRATMAIAVLVMTIDVAHFGWFFDWRYPRASAVEASTPEAAQLLRRMAGGEGRVLAVDGASMANNPLRPNLNLIHGIASVTGYTPLLPQRYARFAGVDTAGGFPSVAPSAPILDVLGVRWMAGGINETAAGRLGGECGVPGTVRRVRAVLPRDAKGQLRIASHVSCAAHLPTGYQVAEVRVIAADGTPLAVLPFRVGMETAEWAYDRPDLRGVIMHAKPAATESFDAGAHRGLWSIATIPVAARDNAMVEISLPAGVNIPLGLRDVDFIDERTGQTQRLAFTPGFPGEEGALAPAVRAAGLPPVAERTAYGGMIWSVCDIRSTPAGEIARLLRTTAHTVPEGWAVRGSALVESGVSLPRLTCKTAPEVKLLERAPGRWRLRASSSGSGLVVVSDRYDGGWRATVGGQPVSVLPVDGLIVGVPVPEGIHDIDLWYRPRFFRLSVALCAVALVACAFLFFRGWRGRRWRS